MTPIRPNADINDFTAIGNYYCNGNSTAKTIYNCPADSAFLLKVIDPTGDSGGHIEHSL